MRMTEVNLIEKSKTNHQYWHDYICTIPGTCFIGLLFTPVIFTMRKLRFCQKIVFYLLCRIGHLKQVELIYPIIYSKIFGSAYWCSRCKKYLKSS